MHLLSSHVQSSNRQIQSEYNTLGVLLMEMLFSSSRSTILVCLDIKGQHMAYEPGDHVGIYAQNNAKLVAELLERLALPLDPDVPMFLESRRESASGVLVCAH